MGRTIHLMHLFSDDNKFTRNMFDLKKELLWIEAIYSDIVESTNERRDGYQFSMDDEIIENSNDTIEDIERFIDDSYVKMLEQKNEEKDNEISVLKEELFNVYEVQEQVLMDSYGLPLQFVEEEKQEEDDSNRYKDCHVRLCYELYLEAFERDIINERKTKNFGRLRLSLKGLRIKNIKPFLVSTKHLFKKKSQKNKKNRALNNQNYSHELMLTHQHL